MSDKLGEMLLIHKVITEAQLKDALARQSQIGGGKLGTILTKLRYVSEEQLAAFLGEQLKIPVLALKDLQVEPKVSALVDVEILERHQILPIRRTGESLLVAVVDPLDLDGVDELQFLTGLRVETAVASRANIKKAIDYYFHNRNCPELQEAEKVSGISSGLHPAIGTRASTQSVLQALTELLIEKKIIAHDELMAKVARKSSEQ